MKNRVSVIIPTYNRQDHIVQCIDSILAQTILPHEIIVVDDGSTDNTVALLQQYKRSMVRYIKLEHKGLPAFPRNEGMHIATGEYIAFCDSDDMWFPNKLEIQLSLMSQFNWKASSTDAWIIEGNQERYFKTYRSRFTDPLCELLWNNYIITSSIVIQSNLLRGEQFDTSPIFIGYEDYLLWLSISSSTHIMFINQPLVGYRKHTQSLSAVNKSQDVLQQFRILLYHPLFRRHPFISLLKILKLMRQIVL